MLWCFLVVEIEKAEARDKLMVKVEKVSLERHCGDQYSLIEHAAFESGMSKVIVEWKSV